MVEIDQSISFLVNSIFIFIGGFLLIRVAAKSRPQLKYWIIAFFTHGLGSLLSFIMQYFYDIKNNFFVIGTSGLAVLLLVLASFKEYRLYFNKGKYLSKQDELNSIQPFLLVTTGISYPILGIFSIILILLIISVSLLYRIWKLKQLPTHQFLMYSLILACLVSIAGIVEQFGVTLANTISNVFETLLAGMVLATGLVISTEQRIMDAMNTLSILNEKSSNQLKRGQEISKKLSEMAQDLSASAEEITSGSESIASAQQQISKGANDQVVSIAEGQKRFIDLNSGIKSIREKVEGITQISDTIRNISNQTNMLALNAAIEAARAGEMGRGFNVVADQVRKLADQSRNSVNQTETIIQDIVSITKAQEQNSLEIVKVIDSISVVAEENSASTEEAAATAEEQAASMERITYTAQELLNMAESLEKEIGN